MSLRKYRLSRGTARNLCTAVGVVLVVWAILSSLTTSDIQSELPQSTVLVIVSIGAFVYFCVATLRSFLKRKRHQRSSRTRTRTRVRERREQA
jgi:Kef-type K+ transport system membrane component KefB